MAIAIEDTGGAWRETTPPTSWSITGAEHGCTVTNGNKLVAIVGAGTPNNDMASVSLTWNGTAMTKIDSVRDNTPWCEIGAWYLDSPAAGNNTLVVTNNAGSQQWAVALLSLTDAETGAPAYAAVGATAASTTPSVTVAGSASGDIVVGGLMTDAQASATETDTSVYEHGNIGNDTDFNVQYGTASGASYVSDWTTGSDKYAAIALAIGSAASGTAVPVFMNQLRTQGIA